jgi:hypothetical protein
MAGMGNSKQRLTTLAATVLDRTAMAMMMALDAGGVWRWPGGRTTFHRSGAGCLSVQLPYLQVQLPGHLSQEQASHDCKGFGEKCKAADQTQQDPKTAEQGRLLAVV